jgi:hypothetical protein
VRTVIQLNDCEDYKELAAELHAALIAGAYSWGTGISEADIAGMPDGANCPRQFLAWWEGKKSS